jgi:hypothetical protein
MFKMLKTMWVRYWYGDTEEQLELFEDYVYHKDPYVSGHFQTERGGDPYLADD